jgi:hypothetical protein
MSVVQPYLDILKETPLCLDVITCITEYMYSTVTVVVKYKCADGSSDDIKVINAAHIYRRVRGVPFNTKFHQLDYRVAMAYTPGATSHSPLYINTHIAIAICSVDDVCIWDTTEYIPTYHQINAGFDSVNNRVLYKTALSTCATYSTQEHIPSKESREAIRRCYIPYRLC